MTRLVRPALWTLAAGAVALAVAKAPQTTPTPTPAPAPTKTSQGVLPGIPAEAKAVADAELAAAGQPKGGPHGETGPGAPPFWVRPGFRVDLVARVENARFMAFGTKGRLYLSRPDKGDVLTLERAPDGRYRLVGPFVSGYPSVHGLDFANGELWFTQSGSVHRAKEGGPNGKSGPVADVLTGLPEGGHYWRSILVTPKGFFTSIGDAGNINDMTATDREKIWLYSLDGKRRELYASGIRNTEKLRLRPGTTDLYGADHGSDWWGKPVGDRNGSQPFTDFNPPDEFNHYVKGGFYGHPFVTGDRVPRYEFANRPDLNELGAATTVPAWKFGAHWAANGFAFVTGGAPESVLGPDGQGDAVQALHGSWNASRKVGYRLEQVMFDAATGRPCGARMLVGTLVNGEPAARPADVEEEPGGKALLFTDDQGGAIYRLSRTDAGRVK